ncbi:unnamed protein product [Caenorhabditis bovis]|uniref:GyrI-like small molecule binding domain-containing protein n=1 Tax=Caenorhabditis bovis TaxID=2654633 RepID=A0A8S1EX61_9PELO|nr:unnamed protein product [Caenorhabditis bovis]
MLDFAILIASLAVIAYFVVLLKTSGFLSEIKPTVSTEPKNLHKNLLVFYKYNIGSYSAVWNIINEVKSIIPTKCKTFGIFYDNPEVVPANLLQSAVGVVYTENDEKLFDEKYTDELKKAGFERMALPQIDRAVQVVQPSTGGWLSIFALVNRTYGIVKNYISENRLETQYAVEFYTEKEISIEFPLAKIDEFLVPDYIPTEELEAKLARKKFDSDEEDSESEPDGEEDEEQEKTSDEQ